MNPRSTKAMIVQKKQDSTFKLLVKAAARGTRFNKGEIKMYMKKMIYLESADNDFEYEVCYFWYHHMCFSPREENLISKAIFDGDYDTFHEYYVHYGSAFFPDAASIFYDNEIIGRISVDNPAGFALITYNECECG